MVDDVSLVVYESECLGIFGPTGAGKTVLLNLLAQRYLPDSGNVSLPDAETYTLSRFPDLRDDLTPTETLWLFLTLCGMPRAQRHTVIRETLDLLGLDLKRNHCIGSLSAGERKLVELACALALPTKVILLDEPMANLDWTVRGRVWEYLLNLRAYHSRAIVVATSRPDDADICDRVALMHRGRILVVGSPAELRNLVGPEALVVTPVKSKGESRNQWAGTVSGEYDGSYVVKLDAASRPADLLRQTPNGIAALRIQPRTLDSVLDEIVASADKEIGDI